MVSMRKAAAWTASNLGNPPFEWSVSLPRMIHMRNAHVRDTWRHHNSHLDAKMGSLEGITPSTLALPVMRNSAPIKHVAHLV
jgi:3-dehydroquinate dehydratase